MTEPHAVVLWSVAFEHALSLICAPQRTREGALSWSTPSDGQLKYARAWASFVAEKAHGTTPMERVSVAAHPGVLVIPYSIMPSTSAPQRPFVPPFVRPPNPCESRSDEIQQEIASTWGDES